MKTPLLIAIILVAIGAWFFTRPKAPAAFSDAPPIEKLDEFMAYSAKQAVKEAKDRGITLDYSEKSIDNVELALESCHQAYLKSKEEKGIYGTAIMFGAYIGEVIKRSGVDSRWARNHSAAGDNSFPLHFGTGDANCTFPVAWCHKRIVNGEEDNVAHKYKVFITIKRKGEGTLHTMTVSPPPEG